MIRIAVVDDDELMLKELNELIKKFYPGEISIQLFDEGIKFIEELIHTQYDLVFLDIDMPEIGGFSVAQKLNNVSKSTIVFVSNLEHLVFQSFDYKPLRFVRKSNLEQDIKSAIESFIEESKKANNLYYVKTKDKEFAIPLSEIMFFESHGHDIYLQTTSETVKIKRDHNNEKTISSLYEKYEKMGFIRIHKSFIVNYRHIYQINKNSVILKNKSEIFFNPHNANDIKSAYQYYTMMEG